jgi:protein-tyrosine phosphatase
MTYRITVVCLGNICRSPIGEVVLVDRVEKAGLADLVKVDSAGTGDWHIGHDADPRSVETLTRHGYDISHTARQITHDWFEQIDLVLAMDTSNYANLQVLMEKTDAHSELRMLRSFDPALADVTEPDPELDVPDPYYGGPEGFDLVLDMIERAVDGLVRELPARIEAAK